MVTIKTIKDVSEEAWSEFKSLAAKNRMRNGPFFEKILEEFKSKRSPIWDKILNAGKIISDEEADKFGKMVSDLRKEKGFRD